MKLLSIKYNISVSFTVYTVHANLLCVIFHHGESTCFEAEKELETCHNKSHNKQKKQEVPCVKIMHKTEGKKTTLVDIFK